MHALVLTIFLYACETWTLTAELHRRIQTLEFRCFRKILGIYKDRITNEHTSAENHHKAYRAVRRSPGNFKAAKTEMVWARDKIGRPNQTEQSKASVEGAGRKRGGLTTSRSGPANPSLRLRPWHTPDRSEEN